MAPEDGGSDLGGPDAGSAGADGAGEVGLCASCAHATAIEGERSTFWRCGRHEEEPERFPRFPELPVVECAGYDEGEPDRAER